MLTDLRDRIMLAVTSTLGDLGPLLLAAVFGIFLVLVALPKLLTPKKDPLARLRADPSEGKTAKADAAGALRKMGKDQRLDRFAQYLEPQDQSEFSATKLKLVRAGYRSNGAVQVYSFAQMALALAGLVGGTLLVLIGGGGSAQMSVLTVLGPCVLGYLAPRYWVNRRVQTREEEIVSGFPDALDLLLVCVEAGQSLDQAIIRVARETRSSSLALSEELAIVAHEMKAGKDKTRVLRDLGERVGVQDVNSFVTTLIQSTIFGTSIAEALRVYAEEMRDKRVMRAEEKANKLPTKLTLGTMLFCLPPLLIILIGPSIYSIAQDLSGR